MFLREIVQGSRFWVLGSRFSAAAGLNSGQFNRERNFEKANNEYRTRNNEFRSKVFYHYYFCKKTERSDSTLQHSFAFEL